MDKKPTAFEQSLTRINAGSQALFDQSQKASLPVLNDLFMHALQIFQNNQKAKLQMPQDRAKKGSFNISNLKGGEILKSDGSVDQPQQGEDNSFQGNTQPQSALSALMEHISPVNESSITPSADQFNKAPQTPTQNMTSDLINALNTQGVSPTAPGESYPVAEGSDGQPGEFYAGLQGKTGSGALDRIKDFLDKRLLESKNRFNPQQQNVDDGSNNRVQLGLRNSYGAMFKQAPPTDTATPSNQVWQNLFKELGKEDDFGG